MEQEMWISKFLKHTSSLYNTVIVLYCTIVLYVVEYDTITVLYKEEVVKGSKADAAIFHRPWYLLPWTQSSNSKLLSNGVKTLIKLICLWKIDNRLLFFLKYTFEDPFA